MAGFEYCDGCNNGLGSWRGLVGLCDEGGCGWGPTLYPLVANDSLDIKIASKDHGKTWSVDMFSSSTEAGNYSEVYTIQNKNGIYLPYVSLVFSSSVARCDQLTSFGSVEQDKIEVSLANGTMISSIKWIDTITSKEPDCVSVVAIDSVTDPFHVIVSSVVPSNKLIVADIFLVSALKVSNLSVRL
jgi:hypothetical protein